MVALQYRWILAGQHRHALVSWKLNEQDPSINSNPLPILAWVTQRHMSNGATLLDQLFNWLRLLLGAMLHPQHKLEVKLSSHWVYNVILTPGKAGSVGARAVIRLDWQDCPSRVKPWMLGSGSSRRGLVSEPMGWPPNRLVKRVLTRPKRSAQLIVALKLDIR